jgi:acyl-CoA synthetase (AMP-forming)/AMP-acid ligase II
MIIRGGFNVYPVEVEEQLREMGGVDNVAVVGVPDEVMGEKVVACIIPTPGKRLTAEEVIAFCKKRLANYKVPSEVLFMDQFPMTTIGKTQKFKIQQILAERQKN